MKHNNYQDVKEEFSKFFAEVAAHYGFSPLIGRLYAILMMSPSGASLDELVKASGAAKSTISVAIRQLEKYRVVRRVLRKGDRRDYYAARVDYEQIFRELHETFFKYEIEQGEKASRFARAALEQPPPDDVDWPSPAETEELLSRIGALERASALLMTLLTPIKETKTRAPLETITVEVSE